MNFEELDKKQGLLKGFLDEKSIYKKNYLDYINVKLTYNSNAIEGNTLSEVETALVIEKRIAIGGKSLVEHQEVINHYDAFNHVFKRAKDKSTCFLEEDILKIHSYILDNINDDNKGTYRDVNVRVLGSNNIFPNHVKVRDLMEEFDVWLKSNQDIHPVKLASEAHYKLVSIHPFIDGNGRTARLLMNGILMQKDYPPMIIENKDRAEYIGALESRSVEGNDALWNSFIYSAMDRTLDYFMEVKKEVSRDKKKVVQSLER